MKPNNSGIYTLSKLQNSIPKFDLNSDRPGTHFLPRPGSGRD